VISIRPFLCLLMCLSITNNFARSIQPLRKYRIEESEAKSALFQEIQANNYAQTQNQSYYDVIHYDINLNIDPDNKMLSGEVTVIARVLADGLSEVELNFEDSMTVDTILCNSNATIFSHQNQLITVQLNTVYSKDQLINVKVCYHGRPAFSGFGAFQFGTYGGRPMIWTLSEPFCARNWWPCKDIPADKADSVDMRVTVPADLIVASNGLLRQVDEKDNLKTYWWHEGYPITTYLVSLAIHPYTFFSDWYVSPNNDSMEVEFYVFPDHYNFVRNNYAKTVPMIETFSALFGEYPFIAEKYGHAEFQWNGGMEHQTITSLGGSSEGLIVHELAHQWWGDMITCDSFYDIWLNEGFATYCEALWYEQAYGQETYHNTMQFDMYIGPGTVYVENLDKDDIFDTGLSYQKGSWVLHMLRHVVGDSTFFKILREYYNQFKYKTATTEQFRTVCEEVSKLNLVKFFDQWIYQEGYPIYEYAWSPKELDSGTYQIIGGLSQTQSGDVIFEMPVDITILGDDFEETFVLMNTSRNQAFNFAVPGPANDVIVDRRNWILKKLELLTSPKFEIQSISINDSTGDGNGRLDQGETVSLTIGLRNTGAEAKNVHATLEAQNDDIVVVESEAVYGDMTLELFSTSIEKTYKLQAKSQAESQRTNLVLTIFYDQGQTSKTITVDVGQPTILLVDDDNGANYEYFYQKMADAANVPVNTWSVQDEGLLSPDGIKQYKLVVWFTGDDRTTSLTSDEQDLIREFLLDGGELLLVGQNIGFDLVEDGSLQDSLFYAEVLHARYISDITPDYMIIGMDSDPAGEGARLSFEGLYESAGNPREQSVISPIYPAITAFQYIPSLGTAGIRSEDEASQSRLVYLAFGLEAVAGPLETSSSLAFTKIVQWLLGHEVADEDAGESLVPDKIVLLQNYPNPFNPSTQFKFYLPQNTEANVALFNTLGQKVKSLFDGRMEGGWHQLLWDGTNESGRNVASGIYLFHLVIKSDDHLRRTKTIKLVKMN
jgi:aminopeptidase N